MEQDQEESSAWVQPLTAHPQLVNGAGPGRDTASDSTLMTPGEWSGAGESSEQVQPLAVHPQHLVNGAGLGRVQPGYSL